MRYTKSQVTYLEYGLSIELTMGNTTPPFLFFRRVRNPAKGLLKSLCPSVRLSVRMKQLENKETYLD
jgi:hypothetical protein